jgi:hypothetical protein
MTCIILFSFLAFKQYSVLNILSLLGEITESMQEYFNCDPDAPNKTNPGPATIGNRADTDPLMHQGEKMIKRELRDNYTLRRTSTSTGQRFMCEV